MKKNKYNNGKIYTLRSYQTDKIYIGSTTDRLCNRKAKHKYNYKKYLSGDYHYVTSFELIKYDDCYIELLEKYSCDSKEELSKEEGEYIKKLDCVNKQIAGRTRHQWVKDNKDKMKKYFKEYNSNRDKEKTNLYHNNYYHINKHIIRKKITCKCGSTFAKQYKAKHERSKKHITAMS
jgi:hypothetical protein